ncbi:MBL fold metallo-hydrolase [Dysgonomonadaceae bacterium zrk40]|nr:MBL fold metallo-hydrolase [Dysgonomonadaceae bacterium zrk40]
MKKSILPCILLVFIWNPAFMQASSQNDGKIVFNNDDVVFRQIDEHTWVGSGNQMFQESLYLVEGNDKAILIDAGTNIKNLDKIIASITDKPVTLVATHVHPDHTGPSINCFPEIYINPGDTVLISTFMSDYRGEVKYLQDGEILELGNRQLEVVFTPGHTPGSTTFIDNEASYGFSGDSFGSSLLLLTVDFSTFIATCEKICAIMEAQKINYLFPGHYNNHNAETLVKLKDMASLSHRVLFGDIKGGPNPDDTFGLRLAVDGDGYRIIYNESALK